MNSVIASTIALLVLLPLAGCENTAGNADLDTYIESLMLQGYIDAEKPVRVQVTRTIPPLEKWSIERAALDDAEVVVEVDGERHTLQHEGKGIYTDPGLVAVSEKEYRVIVRWQEKEATVTTLVPSPVTIGKVVRTEVPSLDYCFENGTTVLYQATIQPRPANVYRPRTDLLTNRRAFSTFGYSSARLGSFIGQTRDTNQEGLLELNIGEYCLEGSPDAGNDTLVTALYIYDEPFYDFYLTSNNGAVRDDVLESASTEVAWNVEGEGIGYVIGRVVVRDTIRL